MPTLLNGLTIPFLSVRLSDFHTCNFKPEQEEEVIELLAAYPEVCDGVWFATDYGFPTLELHREAAERMARMAGLLRARGIACSLQISNNFGHAATRHLPMDGITWDGPMVGAGGRVRNAVTAREIRNFTTITERL